MKKIIFKKKLNELKKYNIEPAKMLEFAIMVNNFKESQYVKDVVRKTLENIKTIYPNQEVMLIYLSIFKYFADLALPQDVCKSLKENGISLV